MRKQSRGDCELLRSGSGVGFAGEIMTALAEKGPTPKRRSNDWEDDAGHRADLRNCVSNRGSDFSASREAVRDAEGKNPDRKRARPLSGEAMTGEAMLSIARTCGNVRNP